MSRFRSISIILLLIVISALEIRADFSVSLIEYNLPPMEIDCAISDREGYLWYGNSSGLYRDDKYGLKTFAIHPSGTGVCALAESPDGNIWIGTHSGIWRLRKRDYSIERIDSARTKGYTFQFIYATSDGTIWVGRTGVLSRYSSDGKWARDYKLTDRFGKPAHVSGFCESRTGEILMTSFRSGLLQYNRTADSFEFLWPLGANQSLGTIIQDRSADYFWVNDHNGHIYRFDPHSKDAAKRYISNDALADPVNPSRLELIRSMVQDGKYGYLWVVSRSGVRVYRPEKDGSITPQVDWIKSGLLGSYITFVIPVGESLKVLSLDHPAMTLRLGDSSIGFDRLDIIRRRYFNEPFVTDIEIDRSGEKIWLIQLRTGLLLYDLKTGSMTDGDSAPQYKLYKCDKIAVSGNCDGIWVSSKGLGSLSAYRATADGGILRVDSINMFANAQPEKINDIYEDRRNRLWVATTSGLRYINLDRRSSGVHSYKVGHINKIAQSQDGTIWAAGSDGLTRIDPYTGNATRFSLRRAITSLAVADNGNLWLGDESGSLLTFDVKTRKFIEKTRPDNRVNDKISDILVDQYDHVWIIGEDMLVQYGPRKNSFRRYSAGANNGLTRYLAIATSNSASEQIVASGIGGLMTFRSSNLLDMEPFEMMPIVSDIIADGKSLDSSGDSRFADGKLYLARDASNVEFKFTVSEYANTSEIRFAYMIEGVDKDWNYTKPGSNTAFYNLLPQGTRKLRVKVCDETNQWSSAELSVQVEKESQLYASWWAIIIYIIAGCMLIAAIVEFSIKKTNKKNDRIWADSDEMLKMKNYLESTMSLPNEEFRQLDKALLKKITETVEKNMANPKYGINNLAADVNMSKSTLARKLKAVSGMTPSDFIRQIKIQHACHLLENQNHTVTEVADMVGFDERRYFSTIFKKETGVTPSEYMKGERAAGKSEISLEINSADTGNEGETN